MLRTHFVWFGFLAAVVLAGAFQPAIAVGQQYSVTIDAGKTGEPISKFVYGQFIEHLGRCIYGGIWAEMLEDRKFYFPITAEYDPYRGTRAVTKDSPFAVVGASPWQIIGPADSVTMVKEGSFVGEHTPLIQPGGGIRQLDLGLVKNKKYIPFCVSKTTTQSDISICSSTFLSIRSPGARYHSATNTSTPNFASKFASDITNPWLRVLWLKKTLYAIFTSIIKQLK
jgi:alpha-N-arabinofuranosidase